jgi:lipoprotein
MKALIIMFTACVALTFAACGNNVKTNTTQKDSDTTVVDSVDTVTVDSVVADSIVK